MFAERMRNPGFVHHVRVLVGGVRHDDFSSVEDAFEALDKDDNGLSAFKVFFDRKWE